MRRDMRARNAVLSVMVNGVGSMSGTTVWCSGVREEVKKSGRDGMARDMACYMSESKRSARWPKQA
jgi:hypothetical protein